MRVRTFELRLIATSLVVGWAVTAGLMLAGYRPGGPLDLVVGLAAALPLVVALAALVWPPVARGDRAFAALVWLGLATLLVLVPSIGGLLVPFLTHGPQTLLPSLEAGYPWLLALLGTALFAGLGVARRHLGDSALRRRRLARGTLFGVAATCVVGLAFGGAAVGNETALRERPPASSIYGPTDPNREPPTCDLPVAAGATSRVELQLDGDVDGRSLGTIDVRGVRSGGDFRWAAYVATNRELAQVGAARVGNAAWRLVPAVGWQSVPAADVAGAALDRRVVDVAIRPGVRAAAEMHGIATFGGARARHCRVAIDGATFRAAFPEIEGLIGDADLSDWRGELDYWVFTDGELGQVSGGVNGYAGAIVAGGLQGHLRATMIAVERDGDHPVDPPTR